MEVFVMTKNIVLCSDGTGSKGIQKRGTNVYKLYEAVDLQGNKVDTSIPKQIAFYDDGVGTETSKWRKILGSAFGYGLSKNVKELYADLVRTYNVGDRIYLFGFSRGAFTVRTLAGFINTCGIIDRIHLENDTELSQKVDKVYEQYRRKYKASISPLVHRFRDKYYACDKEIITINDTPIEFIGVWDTVDAVGLPIQWLADKVNKYIYCFKFTDSKLSPEKKVRKACHALSIDDERLTFHPALWNEEGEEDDRVEQVWFAGVHSNVGGGYPKHGMSLVSLDWMMSKAEQAGLKLDKDKLRFIDHDRNLYRNRRNVNDKLYDSRSGAGVYYRYEPRDISGLCKEYSFKPRIHDSVIDRIMQRTEGYAPGNIPFNSEFVSTENESEEHDKFKKVFCNHYKDKKDEKEKSLLDRRNVKRLVSKRCKSHRAFLITSIITILFIVSIILVANIPQFGIRTFFKLFTIASLIELFKGLLAKQLFLIITVIAPVIVPIVFYLIIRRLKKEMNRIFSEFWYTHLIKLQIFLNNTEDIKGKEKKEQHSH
jgi:uncharacterized protein (DUF2235 family)